MNDSTPEASARTETDRPQRDQKALGEFLDALQNDSQNSLNTAFGNADEFSENAHTIDSNLDKNRNFIINVGRLGVLPKEIIDAQLAEHDETVTLLGSMATNNTEIIEQTKIQYGLTKGIMDAIVDIMTNSEEQKRMSEANKQKMESIKDEIKTLHEKNLVDETFGGMVYNAVGARIKVMELMHSAARDAQGITIVFFDINNFKLINDVLGHNGADTFMGSMVANLRSSDIISRLHGDEFMIVGKTEPEEELDSPAADSIGFATRIINAHHFAAGNIENKHGKGKSEELDGYIGAKIGIVKITGEELAATRGNNTRLGELYDKKTNMADIFGTSIVEKIGEAIATEENEASDLEQKEREVNKKPQEGTIESSRAKMKPSRVAILYEQMRTQAGITKPYPVGAILEVKTDPKTLKHTFEQLVTVLDPERLVPYTSSQLKGEFETRRHDVDKLLPPELARDIILSDPNHEIDLRDNE